MAALLHRGDGGAIPTLPATKVLIGIQEVRHADQSRRTSRAVDHRGWLLEPKFDRFRAAADTVRASRNRNHMKRFEEVLDLLPKDHVFDGELAMLDDAGRP
jgi:hypothetical protein